MLFTLPASARAALKLVPHSAFTFAKLWLLAAKLEVSPDGRCCCVVPGRGGWGGWGWWGWWGWGASTSECFYHL